jgi:prepilin-type N-terminal cleavage/methylation domain-containing protein
MQQNIEQLRASPPHSESDPPLRGEAQPVFSPRTICSLSSDTGRLRKFCSRSPAKGLTLIEVIVALAFLGIMSVGMSGLAIAILHGNAKSRSISTAVYLVNDRLETVRNTAYAGITSANFPSEGYGTISVGNPPVLFSDYQRAVTIQNNTPVVGAKRVVVTVSWHGGGVSEEVLVTQ